MDVKAYILKQHLLVCWKTYVGALCKSGLTCMVQLCIRAGVVSLSVELIYMPIAGVTGLAGRCCVRYVPDTVNNVYNDVGMPM